MADGGDEEEQGRKQNGAGADVGAGPRGQNDGGLRQSSSCEMERQGRIGAISGAQSLYCPLGESLRDQLGGKH